MTAEVTLVLQNSSFASWIVDIPTMDPISALVSGLDAQQAVVNGAAQQLAAADLPTSANPDPTNPAHPDVAAAGGGVDVAQQLTTLMAAADAHHLTTAALRAALSVYQDALDIPPASTRA